MNISLTGSHGFIGSHLLQHLYTQGHVVDCWDLKIGQDIKTFQLRQDTHLVIHLAALADVRASLQTPDMYWQTNVDATKRIFDQCAKRNIKVIYASSSTAREWWRNPYAITKKMCEQMAPQNSCGMRFSTVWGNGARPTMLIPRIKSRQLTYATEHVRDFIHVSDIVSAIDIIVKKGCVGVVDIGSGQATRVDQLVAKHGIDVPIQPGDATEQDENVLASSSLRALGWTPKINVMDAEL